MYCYFLHISMFDTGISGLGNRDFLFVQSVPKLPYWLICKKNNGTATV